MQDRVGNCSNTYGIKNSRFDALLVLLLFSSLYLGSYVINIGLKITITDIVILFSLFLISVRKFFRFRLNFYCKILILLIIFNAIIEFLSVIFVDHGIFDNVTLGVALIRNALLIFVVVNLYFNHNVLKWFVVVGAVFSLISILGYVHALLNINEILNNPALLNSGKFYMLDRGVLRLQGLSGDPNFFFLINLIPLYFGITLIYERFNKYILLLLFVILTASLLTFSRSGIFLLALASFVFVKNLHLKKLFFLFIIAGTVIIASLFIFELANIPSLGHLFVERFEKVIDTGGSGRIDLWVIAWKGFEDSILIGQGGRYTLREVGKYVHNDYLELLSSHGIIGFTGMLIVYIYSLIYVRIKYTWFKANKIFVLASHLFIFFILASLFFTIYYTPYIWFVLSLVFSASKQSFIRPTCNNVYSR